ncbi:quinone oxidoreductase family protein [Goodfellowiella coeruleoviolacea]|uniref:NADPH2:quinone reductase n=1 Tax=Goodfellowiella coeruleoviolacea TaxID=334858 RepID=A0AAE3GF01_9PSEU|nr:zinc-binding dehydrogenase [Goodfellowiella coeruleoviolacea]MCP2166996.1 NADPH2:quinone reductase [Goodfellowiella coeruleoviolacea]
MRALLMDAPGGAERSEVREVAVPRPGPGEVTVDVAFAGLNFMDVMARRGDAGYAPSWPYAPGLEVAGTVRELGAGVTALAVGQRVAAVTQGGGMAEVAVARAELTVPVPDGVELRSAAAAPLGAATALLLLDGVGGFTAGQSVLVHSAGGGIGGAIAELVPLLGGGRLLGTVGRPSKVAEAASRGYHAVFARGDGLVDAVREATDGRGVDLVLDPLGTAALQDDLAVVAPGGRIVLFGNAGGTSPAPLPSAGQLIGGNITIAGFSHRGLSAAAPARVSSALRRVLDFLAAGELRVPVTVLSSLADIPGAHDLLAEGRGVGKYVARVS